MQGDSSSMFVYDSGSGYLTVTAESCTTCSSGYYNFAESETSGFGYTGYDQTKLMFGSANFSGQMMTDRMCLDEKINNTCVDNFGFFQIEHQIGFAGLNGILGFSPYSENPTGPSYMRTL